jgi:hypothetical protein
MESRLVILRLGLAAALLCACTAPRSVTYSPQAAAKHEFRLGGNLAGNLPTQTAEALYNDLENQANDLAEEAAGGSAPITADSLNTLVRTLIAYSLDPIGAVPDFFVRYGVWPRVDLGYKNAGGAHVFDARWQFLGPLSGADAPPAWCASVGAQFSMESYDLPAILGLDKLQDLIGFEFKRKDFLFPVVFGKTLGSHGGYGDFGLGLAYDLSLISYGSKITKLLEEEADGSTKAFENLDGERSLSSFGGFCNLRLGYRFIFAVASFSAYYQDYGTYPLFGGKTTALSGWTFLPTLGLEIRI